MMRELSGACHRSPDRGRIDLRLAWAWILLALAAVGLAAAVFRPFRLPQPARVLTSRAADWAAHAAAAGDPSVARQLSVMGDPRADAAVRARDALTRRGRPVVPILVERLRHADPGMRAAAALVLGRIGDPRALGPLCAALGDADEKVRYRAAYALGCLKDPQAVPSLAPLLTDPSPEVVDVTIRALEECGCKVRRHAAAPGYRILPPGQTEWQDIGA